MSAVVSLQRAADNAYADRVYAGFVGAVGSVKAMALVLELLASAGDAPAEVCRLIDVEIRKMTPPANTLDELGLFTDSCVVDAISRGSEAAGALARALFEALPPAERLRIIATLIGRYGADQIKPIWDR